MADDNGTKKAILPPSPLPSLACHPFLRVSSLRSGGFYFLTISRHVTRFRPLVTTNGLYARVPTPTLAEESLIYTFVRSLFTCNYASGKRTFNTLGMCSYRPFFHLEIHIYSTGTRTVIYAFLINENSPTDSSTKHPTFQNFLHQHLLV